MPFLVSHAYAQIRQVTLHPPARDFGVFPGDLLSSTAEITVGPDTRLDPRSLPATGPVSASVDIRAVSASDQILPDGHRLTIRVTYQSFFAPEQVLQADVPGYATTFIRGGTRMTATVPGFGFSASPFRHDLQPVLNPSVLRPDHPPVLADVEVPERILAFGGGLVLLALLGLAPGRSWLAMLRARSPFAVAALHVARLARSGGTARDALLAVHRAFDETAGRRVLADDLDGFLAIRPGFLPMRGEIEAFFDASRAVFFGGGEPPAAHSIARLCRELTRAERRA